LALLAVLLTWPWPLACVSLALSAGVGVVAAVQADLPKNARRFWSRPLIALLFLLQPIERGFARYRSQLRLRPVPNGRLTRKDLPQAVASAPVADLLIYWSQGHDDRYAFLKALFLQLEQDRWQTRVDSGWADYDLEVCEGRWSRLRLMTATEQLEQGAIALHCRLGTFWSFAAKVLFWFILVVQLVLARVLGSRQPWIWMSLLTLPLLGWFLEQKQRKLRQAMILLLDEVAGKRNWVKL
jgi:hypothetical protein